MITPLRTSLICLLLFSLARVTPAQPPGQLSGNGIDILLLVDVSESMKVSLQGRAPGDLEGVRWDGTSLIFDLATEADRVGLITFGSEIHTLQPPDANAALALMTPAHRKWFAERLRSRDFVRDDGGTPILDTLDLAASHFQQERGRNIRHALVMLLTDGRESKRIDDAQNDAKVFGILDYFRDNDIPIHTIGLGEACDTEWLQKIAHRTQGSFRYVSSNAELLATMRQIGWEAKRLWIAEHLWVHERTVQPAAAIDGGTVDGVMDVGVLVSQLGGRAPRVATAPSSGAAIAWQAGGQATAAQPRSDLRQHPAYWYFYFGPQGGEHPFIDLPAGTRPLLSLTGTQQHSVVFIKRTANALFQLVSPGGNARFRYGEEIPVMVRFFRQAPFEHDQFQVTAQLFPSGTEGEAAAVLSSPLVWDAASRSFRATWVADPGSPSFAEGFYDVAVQVAAEAGALEGMIRQLPRRTIEIGGKFKLTANPATPMVLRSENQLTDRRSIHVDTPSSFQVKHTIHPPRLGDQPIAAADRFQIDPAALRFEGGKIDLQLRLASAAGIPRNKNFTPGRVELHGAHLEETLVIPFNVSLDLLRLTPRPQSIPPIVADEMNRRVISVPIAVDVANSDSSQNPTPPLQASVVGRQNLDEKEVGVVVKSAAGTRGGATAPVAVGQPFHVFFIPKADRKEGAHQARLRITGEGVEPLELPLEFHLNLPHLQLADNNCLVRGAPGGTVEFQIEGEIQGGSGRQPIHVAPREGSGPRCTFLGPESRLASMDFHAPDSDSPVIFRAGSPQSLPVSIEIPDTLPYGVYKTRLVVQGPSVAPAPYDVTLQVTGLRVNRPVSGTGEQRTFEPAEEISLFATPGATIALPLRIDDALGLGVDARNLDLQASHPTDSHQHTLAKPDIATGENEATVTFKMPDKLFVGGPYQFELHVRDPDNAAMRAAVRISLNVAAQTAELSPHNPIVFHLPNPSGPNVQKYEVTTPSTNALQWKVTPGDLQRIGGDDLITKACLQIKESVGPLKTDNPGEIEVTLTTGPLRPGLYVGSAILTAEDEVTGTKLPDQPIAIEVHVAGREISNLRIRPADQVHAPAQGEAAIFAGHEQHILFDVTSFGVFDPNTNGVTNDPGTGRLTIVQPERRGDATAQREVQIDVKPTQIESVKQASRGHGAQFAVTVPVATERVGTHTITAEWDALKLAKAGWAPQEKLTETTSAVTKQAVVVVPEENSGDGVQAAVHTLFTTDLLIVKALTSPRQTSPPAIELSVHIDKGAAGMETRRLYLRDDGSAAESNDRHAADGTYTARLYDRFDLELGKYTIEQLPDQPSELGPMEPAKLNVAFDLWGVVQEEFPIETPGLFCVLDREADHTKAWKVTLADLVNLDTSIEDEVRWTAALEMESYDAAQHPVFALTETAGTFSAARPLNVGLVVGLPAYENPDKPHPAWQPGNYPLIVVLHVEGTIDGQPVQRTLKLPVDVTVRDRRPLLLPWLIVALIVAGGAVGLVLVLRQRSGRADLSDPGSKPPPADAGKPADDKVIPAWGEEEGEVADGGLDLGELDAESEDELTGEAPPRDGDGW